MVDLLVIVVFQFSLTALSSINFCLFLLHYVVTSHTAAIAAGNNGIPVRMHGFEFGRASGMAPRARWGWNIVIKSVHHWD